MKIYVVGALGKMGQLIIRRFDNEKNLHFIGGADTQAENINGIETDVNPDAVFEAVANAQVVVDFSYPTGTDVAIEACEKNQVALITGTTGLMQGQRERIGELAKNVPVVQAPNFSIGVTLLAEMVRMAAKFLPDADVEIVEKHHRYKKDSPSGTALQLGRIIANTRHRDFESNAIYGRGKETPPRGEEIGFHSIRGGNTVGEHEVLFFLKNEILSLKHEALNREIFVDGVIKALNFISTRKKGLYSMRDVLGLNI